MSNGANRVILVGNVGTDVEVRYVKSGTAVCNLRLAVTERVKDGDSWKDETTWLDVVTWAKLAENCGQYLKKGRQVFVDGRLISRTFKDKDGNERTKIEVVAREVLFLGGGERGEARSEPPRGQQGGRSQAPNPASNADLLADEEMPF